MAAYINPTVADFKAYFVRDFPYQPAGSPDIVNYIQDADIQKAIDIAAVTINPGLFSSQQFYTIAFLYLTAHFLCEAIVAAGQGASGVYDWLVASKSVGSVSIGLSIPQDILNNPVYAFYTKDAYGAKYLELIYPYLRGNIFTVCGATQP